MPSLREHAAARRAQTQLSNVDAETFRQALSRTAERVAQERAGQTMTENEMVAVVIDRLEAYGRLTEEEYRRFCLLSRDLKNSLALSAISGDEEESEGDE